MKPESHKNLNAKCEFVILSKIDKDGNFSLLHGKPLTMELFNQIPDITISFSEGLLRSHFTFLLQNIVISIFILIFTPFFPLDKRHNLFKYTMPRDFEFAKFASNKLIINTYTDSVCVQFTREAGEYSVFFSIDLFFFVI